MTALVADLGPTVTYDVISNRTRSLANRVFILVLHRDSPVDADAAQTTIEGFHLPNPAAILRSCTSGAALERLRLQIVAESGREVTTTLVSDARGKVDITVWPPRFTKEVRDRYGERVHVRPGFIVPL